MTRIIISSLFCLGLVTGCGSSGSSRENGSGISADSSIIQDESLRKETMSATVSEGMEAIEDANSDSGATALRLAEPENNSTWTRTCEEEDKTAKVSLTGSIDKSFTKSTQRIEFTRSMTGEHNATRVWSYPDSDTAVTCAEGGKFAKIDWSADITGLQLDATFKRSREISATHKVLATDRTRTAKLSFSAEGTREIKWTSQSLSDDGTVLTRTKEIASSTARTHVKENSKGANKEISFTVATKDGANLVVEDARATETLQRQSQKIVSGTLVVSRAGDGRVESAFDNLLMDFSSAATCNIKSGTVTTTFYGEGSDDASSSYKIEFVGGDATVTDVETNEEVADVDLPDCDDFDLK